MNRRTSGTNELLKWIWFKMAATVYQIYKHKYDNSISFIYNRLKFDVVTESYNKNVDIHGSNDSFKKL